MMPEPLRAWERRRRIYLAISFACLAASILIAALAVVSFR